MNAPATTARRRARKAAVRVPAKPAAPSRAGKSHPTKINDYLTLYHAPPLERISFIKHGVDAYDVYVLARNMGTSQDNLMVTLGLPRSTIIRKAKGKARLSAEQSERVIGMLNRYLVRLGATASGRPRRFSRTSQHPSDGTQSRPE
ncbi:hypothetical protein PPGU19_088380 (plasmid) [Paraburkholderia sp. PGU19]|uniref:antitoxin Xre-like helix-turn-helix domain-containing protein n=1 Tax=Paraburkholderia sp. PGU19 TaxID=2735434 RepID=UPI0015DC3D6E|nr:antitoxin Xre-like helix-turn-helix domain-containing protein [Paraburkholderia sp. PGU19]BCG04270.1 hypothetical protein PPGU19_088380 [Paraburkholderia sp. PGU19]